MRSFYLGRANGTPEDAPGRTAQDSEATRGGLWRADAAPAGRRAIGTRFDVRLPMESPLRDVRIAHWTAILLVAALAPLASRALRAQQTPTEYQVKAAYLLNFLKFVEWPDESSPDAHGNWLVGIVGDSPTGDELFRIGEVKNVLGRAIHVRWFQPGDDMRSCNILFISASEKKRLPSVLAALRGSSVLTVADMDNFIGSGGMIQLVVESDHVRMVIDVNATSRARLKVSSKLLALARVVTGSERE